MRRDFYTRIKRRLRRVQLNFRRMHFTLVGDEGKPWRMAIAAAAGVLALALVLAFSREEAHLMSSAEIKTAEDRGMIRVGIRTDMPGLSGSEGLEGEIARRMAAKILPDVAQEGRLKLVEVNSMTACTKLDEGEVDVVLAMMSPVMASRYNYSQSYFTDECILVVKSGTSSFALKNFTVGYLQSNKLRRSPEKTAVEEFLAANPDETIVQKAYASYDDLIQGLMRGDVGGVAMTRLCCEKYLDKYDITPTGLVFGEVDYCAMSASDSTVFADIATIVINEMKESGDMGFVMARYGLLEQQKESLPAK